MEALVAAVYDSLRCFVNRTRDLRSLIHLVAADITEVMKIAILSDIHDQMTHLTRALEQTDGADALICCGDLCSPFVVPALGNGFAGPVHVVFGNNDGDRFRMAAQAANFPNLTLHGEYCELEFGGVTFSVNHFDGIGRALARGGVFDVVCFGHNHQYEVTPAGKTLVVNPGEIHGGLSGTASFVLFDTESRAAKKIVL